MRLATVSMPGYNAMIRMRKCMWIKRFLLGKETHRAQSAGGESESTSDRCDEWTG